MTMDFRSYAKGEMYRLRDGVATEVFPFQYNPTEVQRTYGVEWKDPDYHGQFVAATSFLRHSLQTLELELFFYNRSNGDGVEQMLARMEEFVLPGRRYDLPANATMRPTSPDHAMLVMGPLVHRGVVEALQIRHRIFNRTLGTMCAEVRLSFRRTSTYREEESEIVAATRWASEGNHERPDWVAQGAASDAADEVAWGAFGATNRAAAALRGAAAADAVTWGAFGHVGVPGSSGDFEEEP